MFAPTPRQAVAFAIIAIIAAWSFLFWLQLRLSFTYARNHDESATGFFSTLVAIIELAFFVAVEILILDGLLIPPPEALDPRWFWVPIVLWVLGAIVVINGAHIKASVYRSRRYPD